MGETAGAIAAILDAYRVDRDHARSVADRSLDLFDAVADRYALPASARPLLELGALLHNVGLTTNPPEHHLVGRDIVLRQPIANLSRRDRLIVACMVAFHRKKVRPQQEPVFLALGKKSRPLALQLSAILRVADGLDYSQSQTTHLLG
ncbi:MAG: HD domain-containing protein, partial [Oscillochloris sp.]|nr:HD domain-containing protein [Oscillochloris sp.]